jgi:subtilisin-like proprotein convertase family protein
MNVKTLVAGIAALGIAGAAQAQVTYNGGGFAIVDNNPAGSSSSIVISDPGTVGAGMIVRLNIAHTWVGDLIATISHNNGVNTVSADLFRRPGSTNATTAFGNSNDFIRANIYRWSDSFAGPHLWLQGPAQIPSTDFKAGTNLGTGAGNLGQVVSLDAVFAARSLAGTWTLMISDHAAGDVGSVNAWHLTVPAPGALALFGLAGFDRVGSTLSCESRRRWPRKKRQTK